MRHVPRFFQFTSTPKFRTTGICCVTVDSATRTFNTTYTCYHARFSDVEFPNWFHFHLTFTSIDTIYPESTVSADPIGHWVFSNRYERDHLSLNLNNNNCQNFGM